MTRFARAMVSQARALTPFILLLGVAVCSSSYVALRFDFSLRLVVAHLSIAAAYLVFVYWLRAVAVDSLADGPGLRLAVGMLGACAATAAFSFYALLFFSLAILRDYPTRGLIVGYLREVPFLLATLPLDWVTLLPGVLLAVASLSAVCAAFVWGFVATDRRPLAAVVVRSKNGFRLLAYASILYLTLTLCVPLEWQWRSKEPVSSSWHNVRLGTNSQYGQRDPVEAHNDRKVEAQYGTPYARDARNVILIYVDALRADVTQPYGGDIPNMPFMNEAVRAGIFTQIDMALAACSGTICGLGAILQSRPTWRQNPANFSLPRLLSNAGYRTAYVLSSNHQSYFDLKQYYQPIDFYLDGKDMGASRSSDDYQVLDGLGRLGRWDGRPTFLMIGLVSPHPLAMRRPEHRKHVPDRLSFAGGVEGYATAYRNNYHNGVAQADDVLRRIWRWLVDNAYLRNAVVVITADHGESLGERGVLGHLNSLYNTELRVPLWIYAPGVRIENKRFATQVDIAPTILAALGLPKPSSWTGVSLTDPHPAEWSFHYLPDRPNLVAVVRHTPGRALKFIYDHSRRSALAFEIFSDPLELHDVIDKLGDEEREAMHRKAIEVLQESKHLFLK